MDSRDKKKPRDVWRRQDIIAVVEDALANDTNWEGKPIALQCSMEMLKKAPTSFLKSYLLTPVFLPYYTETQYELDVYSLEHLTDAEIKQEIVRQREEARKREAVKKSAGEPWICTYYEWVGGYRNPKNHPVERTEKGIVKGNWFYPSCGGKKNVNSYGFKFVTKLEGGNNGVQNDLKDAI